MLMMLLCGALPAPIQACMPDSHLAFSGVTSEADIACQHQAAQ
jgi:hypothetical protein